MATKIYGERDFEFNQVLNVRLHNVDTATRIALGATLGPAENGVHVWDTDLQSEFFWNGVIWISGSNGFFTLDSFFVGDIGALAAGATQYSHPLIAAKLPSEIIILADGIELSYGANDRFSYTINGQTITFSAQLKLRTEIKIRIISLPIQAQQGITTTPPPTIFNVALGFATQIQISAWGLTIQVHNLSSVTLFEFNKITPTTGFPFSMTIKVGGFQVAQLAFSDEYLGQPFRYTHSDGLVYNGVFTDGVINF